MIFNACSVRVVDSVLVEKPANIDLRFLNKFHLDYIVIPAAKHNNYLLTVLSDDIFENNKVIAIGEYGVAFPVPSKGFLKAD